MKPVLAWLLAAQLLLGCVAVWWLSRDSASSITLKSDAIVPLLPLPPPIEEQIVHPAEPPPLQEAAKRAIEAMKAVCKPEKLSGTPRPRLMMTASITASTEDPVKYCHPDKLAVVKSPLLPAGVTYQACVYNPQVDIYVSGALMSGKFWDPQILGEMVEFIRGKPPGVVIDAGGNIGQFSLMAALHGHKVFAFEPVEHTSTIFLKSVKLMNLDKQITLFRNALSTSRGVTQIEVNTENAGGSTIVGRKRNRLESIDVLTFDDFLPVIEKQAAGLPWYVVKADIEGCEPRFFMGAINSLIKHRPPLLLVEYTPKYNGRRGCDGAKFFWALSELGYKVSFGRDGNAIPAPPRTSYADTVTWYDSHFAVIHNTYDLTCTLQESK